MYKGHLTHRLLCSEFVELTLKYMSYMLYACSSLTSLDLIKFDTENVMDMKGMFFDCISLASLDLSSFNTKNVKDMSYMFEHCSSLTSLDLSKFDTGNVRNMKLMFYCCSSLASLDLSSFNTEYVRNMKYTFNYCPQLERILVGDGWKTDRVAEGEYMFYGCSKLTGGKGTQHDEEKVGVAYARIDGGKGAPGYLTDKEDYVTGIRNFATSADEGKDVYGLSGVRVRTGSTSL